MSAVERTPAGPRTIFQTYTAESPLAMEFRRLYVRVRRLGGERGIRTLMLTSARRGEGKTTAACYLALTAALNGQGRVGLVDLDLRRPRIHAMTGLPQREGVSEVLRGDLALPAALKSTPVKNLSVLTSGRSLSSPSSLLAGPMLGVMLEQLRGCFDFVVVDAAPVMPVTDAMVLAPTMDATLLLVMAGETPRAVVQRARTLLLESDARLMGMVVNNLDEVLPYYYDYKYYGYEPDPEGTKGPQDQLKEPL